MEGALDPVLPALMELEFSVIVVVVPGAFFLNFAVAGSSEMPSITSLNFCGETCEFFGFSGSFSIVL